MTRLIPASLASLVLTACTQSPDHSDTTFTLSSGVRVVSSVQTNGTPDEAVTQFKAGTEVITIKMREYFKGSNETGRAWLSLPRHGIATLNVGSVHASGPFTTKDESLRDVIVQIKRDRLPRGTTLSVYNLDTAETLAHYSVD